MNFKNNSQDNQKKALVKVVEIDNRGKFVKKVLGFGIKLKKDKDTNRFMFITSSSVLKSPLSACQGSSIVVDRFCSKHPNHADREDHRELVYKVLSSVDENVSFAFFDGKSEDGFLKVDDGSILKTLPMYSSLYAYAFDGKDIVQLEFDKDLSKNYRLTSVSKEGFQVCNAKGAPVISYDRFSSKPKVLGILHITADDNLYPVFLTKEKFKVKCGPKEQQQEEFPPKDEENGSKPVRESDKPETDEVDIGIQPGSEGNTAKVRRPLKCPKKYPMSCTHDSGAMLPQSISCDVQHDFPTKDPDTKDVLVVTGKKQQKDKITNVFEEEMKCLKYKTIEEALPRPLIIELQKRLDPDRSFGGDVQSLADAFGYNQIDIIYLKSLQHPTQELLQQNGKSTLLCLIEKLTKIDRGDVADIIDKHIRNNCACKDCCNLR